MADHYRYHYSTEAPGAPPCLYASFQEIGMRADIYQKPVFTCNNQLIKLEKDNLAYATSLPEPSSCLDMEAAASETEQHLVEYNCSSMQRCHVCDKLLYDLVQGLHFHDRAACPHLAQTSRQLEFTTSKPPTPPPRTHRPGLAPGDRAFAVDLSADVSGSDTVPKIVSRCVILVDKWCSANRAQSTSVYYHAGNSEQMQEIKAKFATGEEVDIDASQCTVHSVGGVLLKYLRELPNPVIPVEMYDMFLDFIEAGKVTSSGKTLTTLKDLVNEMPVAHKSTLRLLLAHFSRLLRWQNETGVQEKHEKLINVFANILIRPPWNRIEELIDNTKVHNDVLQELLREGCWGEMMPPLPSPTGYLPPPPAPKSDSRGFSPQSSEERLHDAPWYWADFPKEQASEIMLVQPDSSFMVRNASTPGDYTLIVKYDGTLKLIKIMNFNGRYGFVEPLEFPSVVTLINWYQCNSMETYNNTLKTKLIYPVIRNVTPDRPSGSVANEVEHLLKINQRYRKQRALYDYLYEWYSWLAVDTQLKCQAFDTYQDMISLFTEQVQRLQISPGTRAHQEIQRLRSFRDKVQSSASKLGVDISRQQGKYRLINGELSITRLEIQQLHKQRELYKTWLKERGLTLEFLNRLTDLEDSLWIVNCQRPEAELILKGKPDGTFLVRPKPEESIDVLSLMYQGRVTHCKILHDEEGNYGFSQQNLPFTSLKDLVEYHNYRSLNSHNDELDICLVYPVRMQDETPGAKQL